MNAHASILLPSPESDSSLATVLSALASHDEKSLVIEYGGRQVQPGYHVTEVKAGSFVTLDCGGNPDAWQETILQVEDTPAKEGHSFMEVGKFLGILAQVDRKIRLADKARLTFEIGLPDTPMQVFDVSDVVVNEEAVTLRLGARAAICKPRHRTEKAEGSACCSPSKTKSGSVACCS
jgi:hypothetical protein